MTKKCLIPIIAIILSLVIGCPAYAVPHDDVGNILDIDHHVPAYWQSGASWSGKTIPGSTSTINPGSEATIGEIGCAITSYAMLYWYHGMPFLPDRPGYIDPGTLRDWMVDNSIFGNDGSWLWWSVGGKLSNYQILYGGNGQNYGPSYQFVAPNHCCDDMCLNKSFNCFWVEQDSDPTKFYKLLDKDTYFYTPDIINLRGTFRKRNTYHSNHVVVVGGYDTNNSSYRVYDPGQRYDLPAQGFSKLYSDYHFIKLLRFDKKYSTDNTINSSTLYGRAHSPVELQFIDAQGRRTGYDAATGAKVIENPMSDYHIDHPISSLDSDDQSSEPYKEVIIVEPSEGNYILKIIGTGEGPYTVLATSL